MSRIARTEERQDEQEDVEVEVGEIDHRDFVDPERYFVLIRYICIS